MVEEQQPVTQEQRDQIEAEVRQAILSDELASPRPMRQPSSRQFRTPEALVEYRCFVQRLEITPNAAAAVPGTVARVWFQVIDRFDVEPIVATFDTGDEAKDEADAEALCATRRGVRVSEVRKMTPGNATPGVVISEAS